MSLRILITGTTGYSMPPPYAGVQKVSLLYARAWRKMGNKVGITFVYKPENADDDGARAEYFFEYDSEPNKLKKLFFLARYFFRNPFLYTNLLISYIRIYPKFSLETILYSAYGVFIDGVITLFKPDIVMSQTALIKTFMVAEVAKRRNIPVVYDVYAEIHDLQMGVNKYLDVAGRKKYWEYFLGLSELVIPISNCSVGSFMYLPKKKIKVFYDTCDFDIYQTKISMSKEQLRDSFKLPNNCFLVGAVGAFHYRKGHDHLIKAVGMLNRQGHDIGAVIVGGSVGIEKWQTLAREEGVEDKIFFFRNFGEEQLVRLHRSLDMYSNLSNSTRSCGLDLALLGAMSSGLPIVVYDNGGLPEAVPGEENGFLVKTNDIEAVAGAILKMYKMTQDERQAMGAKSRDFAKKTDISVTSVIKLDWFKEVINNFNKKRQ